MFGWGFFIIVLLVVWVWLLFENTEAALRVFVVLGRVLWVVLRGVVLGVVAVGRAMSQLFHR